MQKTFVKENKNFLPRIKESVIDADCEFLDSTAEQNKQLVEGLIQRMARIKDATRPTVIG